CEPSFLFFFQAEDGIRDFHVTGVQTCALPISGGAAPPRRRRGLRRRPDARALIEPVRAVARHPTECWGGDCHRSGTRTAMVVGEIGRASCREREKLWGCRDATRTKKRGRENGG